MDPRVELFHQEYLAGVHGLGGEQGRAGGALCLSSDLVYRHALFERITDGAPGCQGAIECRGESARCVVLDAPHDTDHAIDHTGDGPGLFLAEAGVEYDKSDAIPRGHEQLFQIVAGHRDAGAIIVLENDAVRSCAVAREVYDHRLVVIEGVDDVFGSHGPSSLECKGVAISGAPDARLDLARLLVEAGAREIDGVGCEKQDRVMRPLLSGRRWARLTIQQAGEVCSQEAWLYQPTASGRLIAGLAQ